MIFDCFQFFNELDLLKIRLHSLDAVVDRFVISEATVTFSGDRKPLYYHENRAMFREFEHKIIHNVVTDTPDVNPFERDSFQKCAVRRGLVGCSDDDIVLFSDVDEIPNAQRIKEILSNFKADKIYHFAQRLFYFYFNLEEISGNLLSYSGDFEGVKKRKWLGSKMCSHRFLKTYTLEQLRFPERKQIGIRVENGGWHFSYMGGDKNLDIATRVADKIRYAAHQEFNNAKVLSQVSSNISKQRDLFGRKSRFVPVELDDSFPVYVVWNRAQFSHLILSHRRKKRFLSWF